MSDFYEMFQAFQCGITKKYGKELEFAHNPELLDEQSAELLELTIGIFQRSHFSPDSRRKFQLYCQDAVRFFQIVKDCGIDYDRAHYTVEFSDPKITLDLTESDRGRYLLRLAGNNEIYNAE